MNDSSKNHIVAIFENPIDANEAATKLFKKGFEQSQMSVMVAEKAFDGHFGFETKRKVPEGAAVGGAVGVGVGAIAAGLAAVGAIVLPGGALLAAGPLVAALAGAGAGGATGGLVGGLAGLGFTEAEARYYEENVDQGNILFAVEYQTRDEKQTIQEIFDDTDGKRANAA